MTQPYVLQRLSQRAWWVQSFNYGTVFYLGERGVLIFDTLEGVYDNIVKAVASVTDKPITAAIYPHYHADHIGDIGKYVDAAKRRGIELDIIASRKTRASMDLAKSSFPRPTRELAWPRDSFDFEGQTVELLRFRVCIPRRHERVRDREDCDDVLQHSGHRAIRCSRPRRVRRRDPG
jgi:glyoxylase-like metal-dependent hydrolase (beta-lactamase superfamily II)